MAYKYPSRERIGLSLLLQSGAKWIELEDPDGGYELHSETFSNRQISHKKVEISSDWVEGSYTQRSLRNNVSENVSVWVQGSSTVEMMQRVKKLTDTFDQPSFKIYWQMDGYREGWSCQAADYTIESSQPMIFARQVLVKAVVPRLPKVVI